MVNTANSSSSSCMSSVCNDDVGKLILRLTVGGLMLFHGVYKVQHGVGGMVDMISSRGMPGPVAYGAYIGEVLGPVLVILGILTRCAGLMISCTMIMAIYLVHLGQIATLNQQGGYALELQMLYLFGGVAIFFLGAGKFSVMRGKGPWN